MKYLKLIILIILCIIALALVISAITIFVKDMTSCSERGGEIIRGIVWFKCIVIK